MARNAEKARSMLHRFLSKKAEEEGESSTIRGSGIGAPKRDQRRPYLASLVEDVGEAQRWRRHLVGELGTKMLEIQNPSLPHDEVRSLNAALNTLFREKRHWDRRVVQLGGPPPRPSPPRHDRRRRGRRVDAPAPRGHDLLWRGAGVARGG
ncbi:hypothetical protein BU14_0293s0017, partial [Porphyra umbilicalis]